jgi:hypothetical protein
MTFFVLSPPGVRQTNGDIDPSALLPVSRGGGITYFRLNRGFELARPVWKDEKDKEEVQSALQTKQAPNM